MTADMTDIFEAIYQRYAKFQGERDAYTLTGGRLYRTQAPPGAKFPYIIVSNFGGMIYEMFSGEALEDIDIQFSIYDKFRNDATNASATMLSLITIFNWCELYVPGAQTFIRMRREGMQIEQSEEMTHVHISQDFKLERLVPTWR